MLRWSLGPGLETSTDSCTRCATMRGAVRGIAMRARARAKGENPPARMIEERGFLSQWVFVSPELAEGVKAICFFSESVAARAKACLLMARCAKLRKIAREAVTGVEKKDRESSMARSTLPC